MFIFGKLFAINDAIWVLVLFALLIIELVGIPILIYIHDHKKKKEKDEIIYLYQTHYERRHRK